MMANTVDMQQLLMSIDPSSSNQEIFNQMSKGALLSSGGSASPSSLASSGAPSSSSILNEGNEEKDQNNGGGMNAAALLMFVQQQQQQQQMKLKNGLNPQLLDLLAQSGGTPDLSALVGQLTASQNKMNDNESEENIDNSHQSHKSVIVNGMSEDGSTTPPPAKKSKSSVIDESNNSALIQSAFDNLLQMSSGQLSQQNQNKVKDDNLLFGALFPQSMSNLPLMFQSPLHSQFSAMQDFDSPLSAISTPNKLSGVKRQYSSNGKNYCDLCNKEVCNKYFLRTHMLKMHGIVIDENKTVIANIDTLERERMGNLSFRCDTCLTEFKSRHQLRQHKQDVHGVMPLSTPRPATASNKPSMPSTPTSTNSNNILTQSEEKCQICDKPVPAVMALLHFQQEHMNGAMGGDLSHMMALLNQATRGSSRDSDDGGAIEAPPALTKSSSNQDMSVLKCNKCQYSTRDARNLEMHQERHEQMNEAKRRGSDEDEDEALKLTTEAALKMVVQNQFEGDIDATAAALNLSLHKAAKKENDEEKTGGTQHERNSHTSGSISPSGDSIPEGFGKPIGNEKTYPVQSFIVRSKDDKGCFLGEFVAQLPVRSFVEGTRQILFELVPTSGVSVTNGM